MSAVPNPWPPIGQLFKEKYSLSEAEIQDALEEQAKSGEPLGEILVKRGRISRIDLAGALSTQWAFPRREQAERPVEAAAAPMHVAPVPEPSDAIPSARAPAEDDRRFEEQERRLEELERQLEAMRKELGYGTSRLNACESLASQLAQACSTLAARVEGQARELDQLRRVAADHMARIKTAGGALLGP